MKLDLTSYLAEPFEMTAGSITITSQPPTVKVGKLLAAWQELQGEAARRAEKGEPPIKDGDTLPGWPDTMEDLARMMFGNEQYDELAGSDVPAEFITQAAMCAVIYWANGGSEQAVRLYLDQYEQGKNTMRGEVEREIKKARNLSKSGQSTVSGSRKRSRRTEPRSTATTGPRKPEPATGSKTLESN